MDQAEGPSPFSVLTQQLSSLTQAVRELQGGYAQMQDQMRTLQSPLGGSASVSAADQSASESQVLPSDLPEPKIHLPERFSGDRKTFRLFKNNCKLLFTLKSRTYPTEQARVGTVISLLSGDPQAWAFRLMDLQSPELATVESFFKAMAILYDDPHRTLAAEASLRSLSQGRGPAEDYTVQFRKFAADVDWNQSALKHQYRLGLSEGLKDELARTGIPETLDDLILLTIQLDRRLRERRAERSGQGSPMWVLPHASPPIRLPAVSSSVADPEPMQIGAIRSALTPEERLRRRRLNLCLYCGLAGHLLRDCPTRPSLKGKAVSNQSPVFTSPFTPLLTIPLSLQWEDKSVKLQAIIDSGASGCFLDSATAKAHCFPLHEKKNPTFLRVADGSPILSGPVIQETFPLSMSLNKVHSETLNFDIELRNYLVENLAKGFIRHSTSPAGAGIFFVEKKDRSLRPCIDYRELNKITIKNRYPLPLIPELFQRLREAKVFSKLDLRGAYNLVRIREGDEWKTAFRTRYGHFEYLVMPFGLCNAPATFQHFVNDVFRDFLDVFVIIYLDDILVFSNSLEDHRVHMKKVLSRLRTHQLYAKLEKCIFEQDSVEFLGFFITPQGIQMDSRKVSAILDWPAPTSRKAVQRFIGFANFYRKFVKNFSQIISPITSLTRANVKFMWTSEAQRAFQCLKDLFISAPVLHHPDPSLPFILEVDASENAVGAILSQRSGIKEELHPVAFFSHKMSRSECNYDVADRELLAIKLALEEWRYLLEGAKHPILIFTDHRNLEYLRSAKRLRPRQARWALFFMRFNFHLTYRPGTKNTKADALSRMFSPQPDSHESSETILGPNHFLLLQTSFLDQVKRDSGVISHSSLPQETSYKDGFFFFKNKLLFQKTFV
ncbi:uncharacterized protein LOC121397614 [Xenopus laevis]|uniref:ribonuclease H n=1 Tax=Xenopus laevis TaxID=8355 RepID=A0A8J1LPH9_XENLA|nr:uncharacterized protein LOC121397614 [Xenopus laevis]